MTTVFNTILWCMGLGTLIAIIVFIFVLLCDFIKEYICKANKYKRCINRIVYLLSEEDTTDYYKIHYINDTIKFYTKENK